MRRTRAQLVASCRHRGAGSLSYATLGLDAIGGGAMVLYRIFGTKERVSSWLPYLLFHSTEATVVIVCAAHDCRKLRAWDLLVGPLGGGWGKGRARHAGRGSGGQQRTEGGDGAGEDGGAEVEAGEGRWAPAPATQEHRPLLEARAVPS